MPSGGRRHNVEADTDKKKPTTSAIQTWSSSAPNIYHGQTDGIGGGSTEKTVRSQRLLAIFQQADMRSFNTLLRHVPAW